MASFNIQKIAYTDGSSVPLVVGTENRVNATAASTASAAAALPDSGNKVGFIVRCTGYMWIRFGDGSVQATSDANSILCPPGEGVYVDIGSPTHFSVLRVGSDDVIVQVESIA